MKLGQRAVFSIMSDFSYALARSRQLVPYGEIRKNAASPLSQRFRRKKMKSQFVALMLILPVAAFAASNPDASFYKNAAEAGIFEVDAGHMAQEKGNNQQVKDFGSMMVKDHTAANDKLQSIASSKNITLPTSAGVAEMATEAKLKLLSGDTFDKSYVKSQVTAHQKAIALFRKEATSGQDADAKAFASASLPMLHSHLKAATSIATTLGIKLK
jgi:putative membrane protein